MQRNWLSKSATSSEKSRVLAVLGNPTCDLDSAVCALVQGYLEYLLRPKNEFIVVPVLNVTRNEFRLKTEVVYHLRQCAINADLLTFR